MSMGTETKLANPLISINDLQWIKLVELLTENVFALNGRKLIKIEALFTEGGHYPTVYFRLTSVAEKSNEHDNAEVSGFVFGFNDDWDDDVYIHSLSEQGYWPEWLKDNGINTTFNYHEVGLRKLLSFIEKELKVWSIPEVVSPRQHVSNKWRLLKLY